MNRTLSIAALLALSAPGIPALAGNCSYSLGSYQNGFMPDFDQKRAPGPLFFDGMQFVHIPDGLPGDGYNYCSPTAHTNTMAYLANHGFPALMPGGTAQAWGSQSNYERVTDALQEMGVRMQTDPDDGTLCCGQSGLIEYLDVHAPGKFTVSGQVASELYAPSLADLAFCAIAGGFVHIMVGWYENTGTNEWDKAGGHVTTMVALEGWCGGDRKIGIRDPGNGDSDLMAQAFFATNYYTLTPMNAFFNSGEDNGGIEVHYQRTHERMQGYNTSDGRIGLINGYRVVLPKYSVTLAPLAQHEFQLHYPIMPTHPHGPLAPLLPIATAGDVADYALGAKPFELFYVGKTSTGQPDPRVFCLNTGTGDSTVCYTGIAPRAVEIGRSRQIYVLDSGLIRCINPDTVPPQVQTFTPPAPVVDITYNDGTDTLVCLSQTTEQLFQLNSAGAFSIHDLPAGLGEDPLRTHFRYMTSNWFDGSIWIRGETSPDIFKLRIERDGEVVLVDTASSPLFIDAIGLDIDVHQTREHILLARQTGVVAEFEKNPANGQWETAPDSDFDGLAARGGIKLSRSRTNANDHNTIGPQHVEVLPGTSSPPTWDCRGDADQDGDVDFADITIALTLWGSTAEHPADTDSSGAVGFNDITTILTNWGPCD